MFFVNVKPYDTGCYGFDTIEEAVNRVWKKLSKEEKQSIIDAYDQFDPEDNDHYFFEGWLTDNWEKYFSDCIDFVEENKDRFVMGVPSYAICYLIYGEPDGLNDEDIENIDKWVEKMKEQNGGRYFDINPVNGREEYFEPIPPFGLPCNVMDCWILYQ